MGRKAEKVYELLKQNAENVSANHWINAIHEDKFEDLSHKIVKLFTNNTNKACQKYQKETYKNIIKHKEESLQIHIKEMDKLRAENKKLRRKNAELKKNINRPPNFEFKGILKTYSGFTQSNRNILTIEVGGVENYIGNTLKIGDKINIQHWT